MSTECGRVTRSFGSFMCLRRLPAICQHPPQLSLSSTNNDGTSVRLDHGEPTFVCISFQSEAASMESNRLAVTHSNEPPTRRARSA